MVTEKSARWKATERVERKGRLQVERSQAILPEVQRTGGRQAGILRRIRQLERRSHWRGTRSVLGGSEF